MRRASRLLGVRDDVLVAARAPGGWQRTLERAAARLKDTQRGAAWLSDAVTERPHLDSGPLLGRALFELTGLETAETATPPSAPRPPSASSYPVRPRRPRPRRRDENGVEPAQQETAAFPTESESAIHPPSAARRLERRASRARLHALADESAVSSFEPRRSRPTVRPPAARPAPAPRDWPETADRWRQVLAERAGRRLRQKARAATPAAAPSTGPVVSGTNDSGLAALQSEWQQPLDGPAAPTETLGAAARPSGRSTALRDRRPIGGHSSSPGARPGPMTARSSALSGQLPAAQSAASRPPARRTPTASDARAELADVVEQVMDEWRGSGRNGRIDDASSSAGAERAVDPPLVAPTLPPLRPSRAAEASTSVSSTEARLGARREMETAVPEDLTGLADRLKKILDEEARRYGIDV